MIVVIADDLTGAAELAGIALQYDLNIELTASGEIYPSSADMLIVATDTRSMTEAAAVDKIRGICHELKRLKPAFIFKKIDSVLRGHILAELKAELEILGQTRALIVAANPGLFRTIVDGTYLLKGKPVHQSSFSSDPEFPILSADVIKMLRCEKNDIQVLKPNDPQPAHGIIVGEVSCKEDVSAWAAKIDKQTAVAGGAEFFTAFLQRLNIRKASGKKIKTALQTPAFIICGSAFNKLSKLEETIQDTEINLVTVPPNILDNGWNESESRAAWIEEIVCHLRDSGTAMIAVDNRGNLVFDDPGKLRLRIGEACATVAEKVDVKEWIIEGGATSASVLKSVEIDHLYPLQKLAPGVIRMGVTDKPGKYVTMKPGSYAWPASLFHSVIHPA